MDSEKTGSNMIRFTTIIRDDEHSRKISSLIRKECEAIGWIYDEKEPTVVISIGGDGTLLRAIHHYIDQLDQIGFIGIHTGTLGFFTDYTQSQIPLFLQDVSHNPPSYDEFSLLELTLEDGQVLYAFNEFRIESFSRTLKLDIYINHEFFERSTGSGICVCSQSGSTAINRALGGAVIDDGLSVMELCEIMPISHKGHHSLKNPYIMRDDRIITIESEEMDEAQLCYDHFERSLRDSKKVDIKTSTKKVRFFRYRPYSYLKRLKNLY
ncbi:NAD(+)/NADH kinase [Dubosiella newyorkensis]|uniref:NAD(+)/NADH kinase n=1 Tax=Dubosiella newyorkensis TaxID=1862672 RepID=UPI003F675420